MSSSPSSFQKQQISKPSIFRSGAKYLGGMIALIAMLTVMASFGTSPSPQSSSRHLLSFSQQLVDFGYKKKGNKPLGNGNYGTVYRTTQAGRCVKISRTDRKCRDIGKAYKDLVKEYNALIQLKRFLGVPNLTEVYECLTHNLADPPFAEMVMEEIKNGQELIDLTEQESRKVSLAQAREILISVATTLAAAHGHGYAHTDLHEGNVMLSIDRKDRLRGTKVIDWGSCKQNATHEDKLKDGRDFSRIVSTLLGRKTRISSSDEFLIGLTAHQLLERAMTGSSSSATGLKLLRAIAG